MAFLAALSLSGMAAGFVCGWLRFDFRPAGLTPFLLKSIREKLLNDLDGVDELSAEHLFRKMSFVHVPTDRLFCESSHAGDVFSA